MQEQLLIQDQGEVDRYQQWLEYLRFLGVNVEKPLEAS